MTYSAGNFAADLSKGLKAVCHFFVAVYLHDGVEVCSNLCGKDNEGMFRTLLHLQYTSMMVPRCGRVCGKKNV